MAEYIERESLINHVEDLPTWGADGNLLDREDVISSIENRLAADVAPVRHGRWEDKPNPQWRAYDIRYCSACGWSIHKTKLRKSDLNWEYCPNCGCKMDLEAE